MTKDYAEDIKKLIGIMEGLQECLAKLTDFSIESKILIEDVRKAMLIWKVKER